MKGKKNYTIISYIFALLIIMSISSHAVTLEDNNNNNNKNEGDLVGTSNPIADNSNNDKWDILYYYCQDDDCFSIDNIKSMGNDYITVMRGNLNKYTFERFFSGNIRIDQIKDDNLEYTGNNLTWLGPRLTLSDPKNIFKKYEIRFYSEDNPYRNNGMLQINYVDRTNWFNQENSNGFTPSQVLKQVPCDLKVNETYFFVVSKTLFGNLKVNVMNFDGVTCEVKWGNGMMASNEFELGVQSAGKYVISSFSELISY